MANIEMMAFRFKAEVKGKKISKNFVFHWFALGFAEIP